MPLFCKNCSNLLVVSTTVDTFHFKCNKCEQTEEPTAVDTLRLEIVSGTDYTVHKAMLHNAAHDPVNPKVAKICPKCDHKIVRQVRIGNEMRIINTCISCVHQWIDGTLDSDAEYT